MSLIQAEKTRAFMSAEPAARRMLLGCQSSERTVDRSGFLSRLATHQLFSSSNEQTAMALLERQGGHPAVRHCSLSYCSADQQLAAFARA